MAVIAARAGRRTGIAARKCAANVISCRGYAVVLWLAAAAALVASEGHATPRSPACEDLSSMWRLADVNPSEAAPARLRFNVTALSVPGGGYPSSFTARCAPAAQCSWEVASLRLQRNGSVALDVQGGAAAGAAALSGVLSGASECRSIVWGNLTKWQRLPPRPPQPLTLHVVPHSHMDPGWQGTTADMYKVAKGIIGAVVEGLQQGSAARTFSPEISVYWNWFYEGADAATQAAMKKLFTEGRLEFAGGGWVQHDEACTRVEDLVDQTALGHLWMVHGGPGVPTPPVSAWSADPFGHSAGSTFVYARTGASILITGRQMTLGDPINDQTAALWHPLASFPDRGVADATTLLTHEQTSGYWNPFRSLRDMLLNASAANITRAAGALADWAHWHSEAAFPAATNVLVMFGDDFKWVDAVRNGQPGLYDALDAVIDSMNANSSATGVTARYSTPSAVAAALAAEGLAFPARGAAEDMMPLIGCEFSAPWTGFYVSRPGFKSLVHAASSLWRASARLHALMRDESAWLRQFAQLKVLWSAVAIAQHHDAITGDSYGFVTADFARQAVEGVGNASRVVANAVGSLGCGVGGAVAHVCFNASAQPCAPVTAALGAGGNGSIALSLHNPLAWERSEMVELLVPTANVAVTTPGGTELRCQTAPYTSDPALRDARGGFFSLAVEVVGMPPLGIVSLTVSVVPAGACALATPVPVPPNGTTVGFNGHSSLAVDGSGDVRSLSLGGVRVRLASDVLRYSSRNGTENAWDFTTNGAPWTAATPFGAQHQRRVSVATGALFSEVQVTVDEAAGVALRYRLYAGEQALYVWASSGPFDVSNGTNADAIWRLTTDIASNATWHTDSNAMEMLPRVRGRRPWPGANYTNRVFPVASQYYPITLGAMLSDARDGRAMAVLTSTSQGAASMADGELELLLNRAVLDNAPGHPESCDNSTGNHLVTLRHAVVLGGSPAAAMGDARAVAARIANPVVVTVAPVACGADLPAAAPLARSLPPQLELMSLQMLPPGLNVSFAADGVPVNQSSVLLRLRHLYAVGEGSPGSSLGAPVTVDLSTLLLPQLNVTAATEMTLDGAATLKAAASRRIQWKQASGEQSQPLSDYTAAEGTDNPATTDSTVVTMQPMDIRAWLLEVR